MLQGFGPCHNTKQRRPSSAQSRTLLSGRDCSSRKTARASADAMARDCQRGTSPDDGNRARFANLATLMQCKEVAIKYGLPA